MSNLVTVPENKLLGLQHKAKLVDELVEALDRIIFKGVNALSDDDFKFIRNTLTKARRGSDGVQARNT